MVSVTIDRRDGLNSAAAIKGPCRVATTANITLTGLQTVDGVALAEGDRVLVKDQTDARDNGIRIVSTGNWERSADFRNSRDIVTGTQVYITHGTVSAERWHGVTAANPISVGTTNITFSQTTATVDLVDERAPSIVANAMLVDNPAGTARETKTFAEVRTALDLDGIDIPSNLTIAIPAAPALTKANGYRWSIFAFSGGETERAKATAVADYQATMNAAHGTGEKVEYPKWEYPVRSLSGSHGVETAGVDIDVECNSGAIFIAGDVFWNAAHNVFQFVGDTPVTADSLGGAATLKWRGGIISGRQLTADHGTGAGFGNGLMNVVGFRQPSVRHVFFDGGVVTPTSNLIGAGAIDTGCGWNQNVGGDFSFNTVLGFYDLGVYVIGYRLVSTLAANPVTSGTAGSAVVTVTAPAHGMRNGDRCHLKGITTFDGLTFADTEYAVSGVATNTFQVSATSGTATVGGVAGGGSAVVFTNSRSNKRSETILGESTTFQGNFFTRNTNSIDFKRNFRGGKVIGNTFRENANGVATSGVSEYEGGDGKRLKIIGNDFFNTMNWPIRLQGGGPETIIALNTIENWGRQIYDGGATAVNLTSGFPLSAIDIHSMDGAEVFKNIIRMTDNYVGATWITGEEPCAITLRKNTDYETGCVDCTIESNQFIEVPQHFNIESTSVRTRIRKNKTRGGGSVASVLAGTSTVMEVTNNYVSGTIDIGTTGVKTINIAHGLPFTPTAVQCSATLGAVSGNNNPLEWIRTVTTDATNVQVACKVTTAQAGQTVTINLQINTQNP